MMKYKIVQNPDGDDPYGDIEIWHSFARVVRLPLDDAPVHDFNAEQRQRAKAIVAALNKDEGETNTYNIGPLTMEYVFKREGIENVADWQLVLDSMERALEYKNQIYADAMLEKNAEIDAARYEDRA